MSITFYVLNAADEIQKDAPSLNVSNTNAALILERLGLDDITDEIDPEDLLGRALVANIGRDDSGTPARHLHGATAIDCGLSPGYFATRMAALVEVAEAARTINGMVVWG